MFHHNGSGNLSTEDKYETWENKATECLRKIPKSPKANLGRMNRKGVTQSSEVLEQ